MKAMRPQSPSEGNDSDKSFDFIKSISAAFQHRLRVVRRVTNIFLSAQDSVA
jgi:hypothetical protein